MDWDKLMSVIEFVNYVKNLIERDYGSQKQFAEQHDLSQAYVSDVLSGRREPGEKFLSAIGAERVVCYKLLAASDR
jgi:transcriptional regulator with XRE-family HTH domain